MHTSLIPVGSNPLLRVWWFSNYIVILKRNFQNNLLFHASIIFSYFFARCHRTRNNYSTGIYLSSTWGFCSTKFCSLAVYQTTKQPTSGHFELSDQVSLQAFTSANLCFLLIMQIGMMITYHHLLYIKIYQEFYQRKTVSWWIELWSAYTDMEQTIDKELKIAWSCRLPKRSMLP